MNNDRLDPKQQKIRISDLPASVKEALRPVRGSDDEKRAKTAHEPQPDLVSDLEVEVEVEVEVDLQQLAEVSASVERPPPQVPSPVDLAPAVLALIDDLVTESVVTSADDLYTRISLVCGADRVGLDVTYGIERGEARARVVEGVLRGVLLELARRLAEHRR